MADALPDRPATAPNLDEHLGISNGKPVQTGMTNDLGRRAAQHNSRPEPFELLEAVTSSPVTQGQARAIEKALILRKPGFQTIRRSISPSHPWYQQTVDCGEAWLRGNRF